MRELYGLFSLARQHFSSLIFDAHLPPSPSSCFIYQNQVFGYFTRCLTALEVIVLSARSLRVGFDRVSGDDSEDVPSCIVFGSDAMLGVFVRKSMA